MGDITYQQAREGSTEYHASRIEFVLRGEVLMHVEECFKANDNRSSNNLRDQIVKTSRNKVERGVDKARILE